MKNTPQKAQTQLVLSEVEVKAYFLNKDGSKQWFEIPRDMASKVLRLQKMFKQDAEKR